MQWGAGVGLEVISGFYVPVKCFGRLLYLIKRFQRLLVCGLFVKRQKSFRASNLSLEKNWQPLLLLPLLKSTHQMCSQHSYSQRESTASLYGCAKGLLVF